MEEKMLYKGTMSPIYDTTNKANVEKQCLELRDNIVYGEIHVLYISISFSPFCQFSLFL